MGKFSDYDIPAKRFNFHEDLAFGKQGEALVEGFLQALEAGSFEVKTDRYRNGRMVLEIEHNPRKRRDENGKPMWEPSGLSVTKATWWVYVFTLNGEEGAFVILSVERIKRFLEAHPDRFNRKRMTDFARQSSNPSRGYLLQPEDVLDILINPAYDNEV